MSTPYFEAPTESFTRMHPRDLVGACIDHGTSSLLLDHGALPPEFFDLSSGVAGDLVQRITNYGIRMAAVVPDPTLHSRPFQEFAWEANRSGPFHFFLDRRSAVEWLSEGS